MASSRVCTTFVIATLTNCDVSNGTENATSSGNEADSSCRRALTALTVSIALAPGASCTAAPTAFLPFRRVSKS
ncbi:hypothetical protein D3C81_2138070 [compost metagenome]